MPAAELRQEHIQFQSNLYESNNPTVSCDSVTTEISPSTFLKATRQTTNRGADSEARTTPRPFPSAMSI